MAITKATASSIAPAAKGDLVAGSATNDAAVLGVGANNTVLTADSAEATGLKWATPASGGGMTLLSTTSLTGASTTISSISGSYNKLELHLNDFYNDTAGYNIKIYFNSDTTDANYFSGKFRARAVNEGITFGAEPIISAFGQPTSQQNTYMFISMPNYSTTDMRKQFMAQNTGVSDTGEASTISLGAWKNDNAITSITLTNATGNFGAGTAYLYGVK